MANKKNLIPFKKGEKRTSDAGKKSKRGVSIKNAIKRALLKGDKFTADIIADSLLTHTTKGNAAMAKLIMEYIDGKVTDKMEMTELKPPEKITIEFVEANNEPTDTVST